MKPETQTVRVRSTMEGTVHKMGFDPGATAHLMGVLTDLYKNRPLACLREYSTNALDAQIQAGYTGPIEVTTPTPLKPVLTIRDYGVGLDARGIAEVYSQYGASTKRNSDEFNGMLGLGCKAALSYTQQFTVVGRKDGIQTTVAVSRDEDGGGDMRIVDERETVEPNGVEVQIPARSGDNFDHIAVNFFQYWKPGTVVVNGKRPMPVTTQPITDRIHTVNAGRTSYSEDRDVVVMGGVAYPCRLDIDLPWGHGFVCYVNIGEVTFTPSREALRDTKNTQDTLASLRTEYVDFVNEAAQKEIDKAATPGAALRALVKWQGSIPKNIQRPLSYKGKGFPGDVKGPFVVSEAHGTLGSSRDTAVLSSALIPQTVFVHNYELANFTPTHKKKLLMALDLHPTLESNDVRTFALSAGRKGEAWVEDAWRLDWNDVAILKLPKTTAQLTANGITQRISGSYDVWHGSASVDGLPAADFPAVSSIVWVRKNKWAIRELGRRLDAIGATDYLLVSLSANRIDKFERDFPESFKFEDYARKLYGEWADSISKDERAALALREACHASDGLAAMDPKKVDDPALKAAIRAAKVDTRKVRSKARDFHSLGISAALTDGTDATDPLDDYPLYNSVPFTGWGLKYPEQAIIRQHIYLYLNAAFAAKPA